MTRDDLLQIKKYLEDLRFIQAHAMVSIGINKTDIAYSYMKNIVRLENKISDQLRDNKHD